MGLNMRWHACAGLYEHPRNRACRWGRIVHFFITHIVDSAATSPNKATISPCLCWRGATQRLLKRCESFMRWGNVTVVNIRWKGRDFGTRPGVGGGGNTGFSQHSNCCSAGCTCVWRSRKLLNYTPSAGSIGFFDNMHWCHWEQLSSSIAIRHYIFGRKAVNGCFKKKNERKRLNFLLQSAAQQQQIAAVNTRLNGLLGAQWGDRTLDIIMADTGAALCRRRMIHKHGWKKREF